MNPLKIFIGYDSKEPIAWQVLAHSILRRATQPVAIYPLAQPLLRRCYWRERGPTESTEFSLTRFLVPYLSGFTGWSLFLDCDMLCLTDITTIRAYSLTDPKRTEATQADVKAGRDGAAVYVCQHDYVPKDLVKFDGHEQTKYPRKNWSSAMLFDCAKCTALTPEYVNSASGLEFHRFHWLHDDQIGELPLDYNWLVGEYDSNPHAKILHFTNGGVWQGAQYAAQPEAALWLAELDHMMGPVLKVEAAAVSA